QIDCVRRHYDNKVTPTVNGFSSDAPLPGNPRGAPLRIEAATKEGARTPMGINLALLTPLRLLAESLRPCLLEQAGVERVALVFDHGALLELLSRSRFDLALIDVSHGLNADSVRITALRFPEVKLVALGPEENRDEVLRCARCGFVAYI